MKSLPARPNLEQLRAQAKELFADYRRSAPEAIARFRTSLPAAAGLDASAIAQLGLRLHDAQSCIAREYGFASWPDLKRFVEVIRFRSSDQAALAHAFCKLVYAGDIAGAMNRASPHTAARLLADHPELSEHDPWMACATGNVSVVRRQIEHDPTWPSQVGGTFELTPLIATTHSSLLNIAVYRERLHRTVDLLLTAGADPNQTLRKRWGGMVDAPNQEWRVSPLHGAAGVNHDPELTRRLLAAGADPNDGESLYHSLEAPECTRLLLDAGATVAGTNALFRVLDLDDLETLELLVSHAADAEELHGGRLLLWAIRRRRSPAHIETLLAAGVDPDVATRDGVSAYVHALRYGLPEVADVLERAGLSAELEDEDLFLAACARNDAEEARRIQARRPDLPAALRENRPRMLPELAEAGCAGPVALMVDLGWPIDSRGGDWSASALNHAVFRGDAALSWHLLVHGASWTEEHGFGDNVCGTLSWASRNRANEGGDYVGCAEALLAHGMPRAERDLEDPECVFIGGVRRPFSDEVSAVLLGEDDAM